MEEYSQAITKMGKNKVTEFTNQIVELYIQDTG